MQYEFNSDYWPLDDFQRDRWNMTDQDAQEMKDTDERFGSDRYWKK